VLDADVRRAALSIRTVGNDGDEKEAGGGIEEEEEEEKEEGSTTRKAPPLPWTAATADRAPALLPYNGMRAPVNDETAP